ncbi:hypothetical protein APR41_03995 [Salegentibacter salinarum]|uniref:Uncharacterized protein n=1 Tax=Salegentibacter salinarum TaxID=447422 RepID=A0A2N0TU95_9FLAO|nr:hypothetical protein [Salegentibacter salinarum]PKD18322.1 hypothetical protein APR41_03995 [Salegentibacter salinarum]
MLSPQGKSVLKSCIIRQNGNYLYDGLQGGQRAPVYPPNAREFYENLSKAFLGNTMTIKNLFITSEMVVRPDGK